MWHIRKQFFTSVSVEMLSGYWSLRHQFFACLLYLCHFIAVIFSPLKMYFNYSIWNDVPCAKMCVFPILWCYTLVFQEKYCIWNSSYGKFASFVNVCWKLLVDMWTIWRQVKNLFILLRFQWGKIKPLILVYVDIPWYIRIFYAEKIENGERFTIHSSIWQSAAKGEWRVSNWLAISNTRWKLSLF